VLTTNDFGLIMEETLYIHI